jgi:uncharacterized protein YjiS (DUF1127 family)
MPHSSAPCTTLPARRPRGFLPRLRLALGVAAQRHRLSRLDDALLADIGLTRAQAEAEARRGLWDLPET